MRKLKIDDDYDEEFKDLDLKTFVKRFISDYNQCTDTIYAKSEAVQCVAGSYRSMGDITKIAQYYLGKEKATFKKVRRVLRELVQCADIGTSVCEDIGKRVFHPHYIVVDRNTKDEFGLLFPEIKVNKNAKKRNSIA